MEDHQLNQIAAAVAKELDGRRTIDAVTHHKHHQYIDSLLADAELRRQRREQWVRVVGGWGIIVTITAAAAAVWQYLKQHINTGG